LDRGPASIALVDFFNGKVAREQKEVLMNIVWGGASLTSAPGCEIEVGLFISDKALYLLQVLDPEKNRSQALSWYTENAPLIVWCTDVTTISISGKEVSSVWVWARLQNRHRGCGKL